jgi:RNA polymerase sigma factor (sigma-70 family)
LERLVTSKSIDKLHQRIRGRKLIDNIHYPTGPDDTSPGPPVDVQRRELAVLLREAIGSLPRLEGEVFCLIHFNNMSNRQVAKELGLQVDTVSAFLRRARNKIRKFIESETR